MTKQEFQKLAQKPLLLDGATGTNLMLAGMPRGVCTEKWVLDHPDALIRLQRSYAEAGSQIVYAPTFGGNRINLEKHGLADDLVSINQALVKLSREAVSGYPVLIAGDITTTGELMEPLGELTEEEAIGIYSEQVQALVDAGVDLIVAETMMSIEETLAAVKAVQRICDLPILCSVTCQPDGRLFFGGDALTAAIEFEKAGVDAVGLNCSATPSELTSQIQAITDAVHVPVIAKLNAGQPKTDSSGQVSYDLQALQYAQDVKVLMDLGVTIIGGCCGTTPAFIRELKKLCTE